jgi:hypothetical protein
MLCRICCAGVNAGGFGAGGGAVVQRARRTTGIERMAPVLPKRLPQGGARGGARALSKVEIRSVPRLSSIAIVGPCPLVNILWVLGITKPTKAAAEGVTISAPAFCATREGPPRGQSYLSYPRGVFGGVQLASGPRFKPCLSASASRAQALPS